MTRETYLLLANAIVEFIQSKDFKQQFSQYMAYRRQLKNVVNDISLDEQTRQSAQLLHIGLKSQFNGLTGTTITCSGVGFPNEKLLGISTV